MMWLALVTTLGALPIDVDIHAIERAVVIVSATHSNGTPETGAGLVIGVRPGVVDIVTALHVVADNSSHSRLARSDSLRPLLSLPLKVIFFDLQGQSFEAKLVMSDDILDIGFIRVTASGAVSTALSLLPLRPGAEPDKNAKVTFVTHAGRPWRTVQDANAIIDIVAPQDSRRFVTSNLGVDGGASGGPVLDEAGSVIGITVDLNVRDSQAVKIKYVLDFAASHEVNTSMLASNYAPDRARRREVFDAVASELRTYLFYAEAVAATFSGSALSSVRLAAAVDQYNKTYLQVINGRTTYSQDLRNYWGAERSTEFDRTVNSFDTFHKNNVFYSKLNDFVNLLRVNSSLTPQQRDELHLLLDVYRKDLEKLKRVVDDYIATFVF